MPIPRSTQPLPPCPHCHSKFIIKKGRRLNRFRVLQVFQCRECLRKFTAAAGKNKTYPPHVILESVSTYNLGNSISDTQRTIRKRLHVDIPEGTIRSWIRAHKPLTAYARFRAIGSKLFKAEAMIRTFLLRHKQVYRFQLHKAKLELLFQNGRHRHLASAKDYLEQIGEHFPHGMFQRPNTARPNSRQQSRFPSREKKIMQRGLRRSWFLRQVQTRNAMKRSSGSCSSTTPRPSRSKFPCISRRRTSPTIAAGDSRSTSKAISSRATLISCRSAMAICRFSITSRTP